MKVQYPALAGMHSALANCVCMCVCDFMIKATLSPYGMCVCVCVYVFVLLDDQGHLVSLGHVCVTSSIRPPCLLVVCVCVCLCVCVCACACVFACLYV